MGFSSEKYIFKVTNGYINLVKNLTYFILLFSQFTYIRQLNLLYFIFGKYCFFTPHGGVAFLLFVSLVKESFDYQ